MNQSNMEKKPLREELVKVIIEHLDQKNYFDITDVVRFSGYEKLMHPELDIDWENMVTIEWKYPKVEGRKFPSSVYLHTLTVEDYTFKGEEEEGHPIEWQLESEQYTMPQDKKLLKSLITALDKNRQSVNFNEGFISGAAAAEQWTEKEVREAIRELLPKDGQYVLSLDFNDLMWFEDEEELYASLDMEEMADLYMRMTFEQAVEFLTRQQF